jgi:uncharacterized protein YndB with AHSA1/START domain
MAPPARVFRAWTDPGEVRQWFGPGDFSTPQVEIDLRVGGRYRFGMKPPEGDIFYLSGEFRVIEPPKRLVYTWTWEGEGQPNEMLVTVDFLERGGSTEVMLKHERFASQEQCTLHEQGWAATLEKLLRLF